MFDRTFYGKSKDDMNNTSFGRLKDEKSIECADLTNILQVMALELGLICYNIIMRSTKGGDGHSILMIAQKNDNSNGEKKFSWYVIDGQNYLTIRSLLEKFPYWSKKYPKIPLSKMIPIYTQTEVFGYDKVYIVKNNNFIHIVQLDAKKEMVAALNDKLLNRLNEGYDVDWTDDSYVGCFEEFEKDLFKP